MCKLIDFHDYFHYEDGKLYWKVKRKGTKGIGSEITRKNKKGYLLVCLFGKTYLVHRVIFHMCHGWVPRLVDHRDGDTSNNRVENLRAATSAQNSANSKVSKDNTTGYKGVSIKRGTNKYQARLTNLGKFYWLGVYETAEEAAMAYDNKARELQKEFAKLNLELDV